MTRDHHGPSPANKDPRDMTGHNPQDRPRKSSAGRRRRAAKKEHAHQALSA